MKEVYLQDFAPAEEIALADMHVTYSQEADNSKGNREDAPDQTVTFSTRDGGAGHYLNIKTGEDGWSIDLDDLKSFSDLIEDFKHRLMYNAKFDV